MSPALTVWTASSHIETLVLWAARYPLKAWLHMFLTTLNNNLLSTQTLYCNTNTLLQLCLMYFTCRLLLDHPYLSLAGKLPVQKKDLLSGSVSTGQGSHVGANSCYTHLILLALLVPELYRGQFYDICDTL